MIAIVDDDPTVRSALTRLLRAHGRDAVSFPSAEAFLGRDAAKRPECLILDIYLKGMSGLDLRDVLASTGSNLPIIFVTAVTDAPTLAAARAKGAYICLTKPVDESLLLAAIDSLRKPVRP